MDLDILLLKFPAPWTTAADARRAFAKRPAIALTPACPRISAVVL